MAVNQLWAPWRAPFVRGHAKSSSCIFCLPKSRRWDRKRHVVCRAKHVSVMLNRYPYNNGHMLVVPTRHVRQLNRLSASAQQELWQYVEITRETLTTIMHPHGFNVGFNVGRDAGAGIVDHLHVHIVPRWRGDTNFILTCADTTIISDSLDALYDELHAVFTQRLSI